jgi:hypothetical protein
MVLRRGNRQHAAAALAGALDLTGLSFHPATIRSSRGLPARPQCALRGWRAGEGSAFTPIPGVDLGEILCVEEERQVGHDNCVSYRTLKLQIPQSPMRPHFVKARVKAHVYPDGSHALFHGPRCIGRYDENGRLKDDSPVHPRPGNTITYQLSLRIEYVKESTFLSPYRIPICAAFKWSTWIMPRALKKTVKGTKSAKTVKAKTARRVIKPWTKEDVRMLKAHSKARTPVTKVSKVMKRTVGALRRRAGILGVGLGHRR